MYDMNELLPVVARLTKRYTGIESSSVSYEKANQLMGAVIYCIREIESGEAGALVSRQQNAMQAYQAGAELVRKKTEELLRFYECYKKEFCAYGNVYLSDFWNKGMPAFFAHYDEQFEPQNTILTLDYPVLSDLAQYQGIDLVDLYVRSVVAEQQFLAMFGEAYVREVLRAYCADYAELPENLAAIVFGNVIGHILAGKKLTDRLCEADLQKISAQYAFMNMEENSGFQGQISELAAAFLAQHFAGEESVQQYMMMGLPDICTRMGNAAAYGNLDKVFVF